MLLPSSGVLWYRDYWPNRYNKLSHRRTQSYISEMSKQPSPAQSELIIEKIGENRCVLKSVDEEHKLLDPYVLAERFEPWNFEKIGKRGNEEIHAAKNQFSELVPHRKTILKTDLLITSIGILLCLGGWVGLAYHYDLEPNEWLEITTAADPDPHESPAILLYFIPLLAIYFITHSITKIPRNMALWIYFYDGTNNSKFFHNGDAPLWLDKKRYYVLRYLYKFPFEWTLDKTELVKSIKTKSFSIESVMKIPDWERVELWVDAEKGIVEWIVSDYHYKELWYNYQGSDAPICVEFTSNFHTPEPVLGINPSDLRDGIERFPVQRFDYRKQKKDLRKSKNYDKFFSKIGQWAYFKGMLNYLPWDQIRYPYGADNIIYVEKSIGPQEITS